MPLIPNITGGGERITFNRTGVKYTGSITNPVYNQVYSGNSLNLIIQKNRQLPIDVEPDNVIGRGASFDWNESYNILPVVEYNTYFIQEQVIGMQDLGRGSIGTFEILRIGDNLPTVKTLPHESEMTIFEQVGDDHPNKGMVLNVFFGCRFTGQSGGFNPTGIVGRNASLSYRYRLTGKDYKAISGSSPYPGGVEIKSLV